MAILRREIFEKMPSRIPLKIFSEAPSKNRMKALEVLWLGKVLEEALESALIVAREMLLTQAILFCLADF